MLIVHRFRSPLRTVLGLGVVVAIAGAAGFVRPGGSAVTAQTPPTGAVPPMAIGMNLGSMNYWSQEFPFADIIKSSEIRVVTRQGWLEPRGQIPLDARDRPINVAAGTRLAVIIKSGGGDRLPSGTYDCRMSPGWSLGGSPGNVISGNPSRFVMRVLPSPSTAPVRLMLVATAARASLAELACTNRSVPGGAVFNPVFLNDNRPFGVIRFMDWQRTNNQPAVDWSSRTTPASFSQISDKGVAVEHMVALANELRADPWFTQPLDASDEYYQRFAEYVRDNLAPGQRVYVEVSNEVWNGIFDQNKRATRLGKARYPTASDRDANDFYYADRVRAVMTIWARVFAAQPNRLVRVLATQAGSELHPNAALSHANTARYVDALAIAPYFGPPSGRPWGSGDVTEYLINHGAEFVDRAIQHSLKSKQVANRFGLKLITYEGGPAFVSRQPSVRDAFERAERDQRLYGIYMGFLRRWKAEVGGLYVAYDSVKLQWGHRTYTGQPLSQAPKARALVDFMRDNNINPGRVR